MLSTALIAAAFLASAVKAQVTATGTMGTTNPPQATMGTPVNQSSYARLLSLNAIDDFCLFAPPTTGQDIGDSEEIEVAWCVQARNNARVIPDGVFTAVHMLRTPLYWQIQGYGDFTQINIESGDEGGELDAHGSTGFGNPVGGNVTCNATGEDVSYQEWMNYMAYNQFCLRICIAENATYSAAIECEHTFDLMGCEWVMPGDYSETGFTDCLGDAAYPPGVYPLSNGSTSTFAQRYTGTYTSGTETDLWTIGYTSTPQTPFSTPASSQCTTYATVSNGIASVIGIESANGTSSTASMSSMSASMTMTMSGSASASAVALAGAGSSVKSAASSASSAASSGSAGTQFTGVNYGPALAGVISVVAVAAGAGSLFL